jgi:hypothetical protein
MQADEEMMNTMKHSDKQNAKIYSDRKITELIQQYVFTHTEIFKKFTQDSDFQRRYKEFIFDRLWKKNSTTGMSHAAQKTTTAVLEDFKIDVEFRLGKGLVIPEHISVPLNSRVEWNIVDKDVAESRNRFNGSGLKFTLYFQDKISPFSWNQSESTLSYSMDDAKNNDGSYSEFKVTKVASGSADQKGDYKYGIRVEDEKNKENLYDEDPWLHVI